MSIPGYNFLQTLTTSHKQRAIAMPPSGKLYEDPRNEHVLVFVGRPQTQGRILPREMAAISPFDSSVQGGDATWGKSCLFICFLFLLSINSLSIYLFMQLLKLRGCKSL